MKHTNRIQAAVIILLLLSNLIAARVQSQTWVELNNSMIDAFNAGKKDEAIATGHQALLQAEKEFGTDDASYATALFNLGYVYLNTGQTDSAVVMYKHALLIRKNIFGKISKEYLNNAYNLASVYHELKDYERAESLYQDMCAGYPVLAGRGSKEHLSSMALLGNLYFDIENYRAAVLQYENCLHLADSVHGKESSIYGDYLNSVAWTYYSAGEYEEAIIRYKNLAEWRHGKFGEESREYISTMNNLAFSYRNADSLDAAEKTFQRTVALAAKFFGETHASYAYYLNNLSSLYIAAQNYLKAAEIILQVLEIRKALTGENDADYILAFNNLAYCYSMQQDYENALPAYGQLLELKKNYYGSDHPEYYACLFEIAIINDDIGNDSLAEQLYRNCETWFRKNPGNKSHGLIRVVNKLAMLYDEMKNFSQAEKLYQEALDLIAANYGTENSDYATVLNNMGRVFQSQRNYVKAEEYILRSNEIYRKLGNDRKLLYASSVRTLADLYEEMGQFAKAEQAYLQGLEISSATGNTGPTYISLLTHLASLYKKTGNYTAAEPLFKEARDKARTYYGPQHREYASCIQDLALFYYSSGNFPESEKNFLESIALFETGSGKTSKDYAVSIDGIGLLYREMGNLKKAEQYTLTALGIKRNIHGENSSEYANALSNAAGLYKDMEQYSTAEQYYLQSLAILEKTTGALHRTYLVISDNLAVLYHMMERYDETSKRYKEVLAAEEKTLGTSHPHYATTLNNYASLLIATGKYEEAEPLLLQSLEIKSKQGVHHPDYSRALNDMAYLYYLKKEYGKAEPYYSLAFNKTLYAIRNNYPTLSETEKELFYATVSDNLSSLQMFGLRRSTENPAFTGTLFDATLATGSLLLESSRKVRNAILSAGNDELTGKYNRWMLLRSEIGQAGMLSAEELLERNIDPTKLQKEADALEKEITALSSVFSQASAADTCRWQDVAASLNENQAAVQFINFTFLSKITDSDTSVYAALIIRKNDPQPFYVPLCDSRQLYSMLNDTVTGIAMYEKRGLKLANTNVSRYGPLNPAIYGLIWLPLEEHLNGVDEVFIAASGLLNKISFAALKTDSANYLCDKINIRYVLNSRDIISLKQAEKLPDKTTALFVGGADFDQGTQGITRSAASWNYLPGTLEEVKGIEKIIRNSKWNSSILTDSAASEKNLKQLTARISPAILHISTHGFFFPAEKSTLTGPVDVLKSSRNPLMRSGLILSGANRTWSGIFPEPGIEDGILTAWEVSNMKLSNTALVVLSACETGLGDIRSGEGVFGLQRAFRLSGAGKIIITLWEVPDKETAELMISFYTNLIKGMDINQAFTGAQNQMRRMYPSDASKWAGFILIE